MKEQRIFIAIFGLALVAIFFTACAAGKWTSSARATVEAKFGNTDFYSSVNNTFTRTMCGLPNVNVKAQLTEENLAQIGELALQKGFFSLPKNLPGKAMSDGSITIVSPCPTYSVRIEYLGRTNLVQWNCAADGSGEHPHEISEIYVAIQSAVAGAQKSLPRSNCRFH